MTIKEVEKQTGLTRSNIRFYEKEKLIEPLRNDKNGYRDYSEKDVEYIKKIAYLRTLEISIEDIRNIMSDKVPLEEIVEKQAAAIQTQIEGLNKAKDICERMLASGNIKAGKADCFMLAYSVTIMVADNNLWQFDFCGLLTNDFTTKMCDIIRLARQPLMFYRSFMHFNRVRHSNRFNQDILKRP